VDPFDGVTEVLNALAYLPHGIVSQNARDIITATLHPMGLASRFQHVIGYQEVAPGRQKPAPDGLLDCLRTLTDMAPGAAFYVGDHPTDAQCAARATSELRASGYGIQVRSIAVLYGGESTDGWPVPPDSIARSPAEIVDIVKRESSCRPGKTGGRARDQELAG
jgi:phosphoglycolate phosphatase-like HAD superfamily hydrolase